MKALTHTPSDIFGNQIRYVVPLFQRPYVWTEADQWKPLWDDVETLADKILDAPPATYGGPSVPPHFLGAIVIEQQLATVAHIGVRHIIDGQQRLTTLQLLLDAAQWVVQRHGTEMDSQALQMLVENNPAIARQPDEVFKVWPTDRDQAAFRAAMDNGTVVPASLSGSRIAQAHAFFIDAIEGWADIAGDADTDKVSAKLSALTYALRDHIRLVVIDLEAGDNAQVIFETLNNRGSPLLASDLVKNLLFQLASEQKLDVANLYRAHWRELDSDYWRQLVAQGRFYRPRIDVFLNRWLTMKLLREVPADRVFADFRDHILVAQRPRIEDLLVELASDAKIHQEMERLPVTTPEGRFYYRVLKALDSQVVGTFLMWLLRQSPDELSDRQREKALSSLESWLVRRALCRLTTKDHNRVVLELLRVLVDNGPAVAGDTTERFLATQQPDSRYWPSDGSVAAHLADEPLYSTLSRARLRMILEALEDRLRGPFGEGQPCPFDLTIEHVMPQAWREHWGADINGDEIAAMRRDRLIQSLGNLTLVNARLNPALSNRPWTNAVSTARGLGEGGKRSYLLAHSQLSLNADIVAAHEDRWTEDDIRARGHQLLELLTSIWPCPSDATQPVSAKDVASQVGSDETGPWVERYAILRDWLRSQSVDELRLTFAEVEQVLGVSLPPSARNHLMHWYRSGSALAKAIRDAGWRPQAVTLAEERVTFQRLEAELPGDAASLMRWQTTDEDTDAARYVWQNLSVTAQGLFLTLMSVAPEKVSASDLAERHDVAGATGVAGALTWPARFAADAGRQPAVSWEPGSPSQYWMETSVAAVFRAAAGVP